MYDLIVIGSGPAGEGAAVAASKNGLNVAVIESKPKVGGNCTFNGTIPSKALRHIVSRSIEVNSNHLFNADERPLTLSPSDSLIHVESTIAKQVAHRSSAFHRNKIKVFTGHATFEDKNTLNVTFEDGKSKNLSSKNIVIATGSSPYRPENINFGQENIFDSNTILSLKNKPSTMIVYGAGVIGCEYASIFRGLGVKVTLINTREHLLEFLDREISDALSYHFTSEGISLKSNETLKSVENQEGQVHIELNSGKVLRADCLLFANGRSGNTGNLGLHKINIKPDQRGLLDIDENYETSVKGIYAIGDVIGYPSLASTSFAQGRVAGEYIATGKSNSLPKQFPTGIYTLPEISFIGKTEKELTESKVPYEVGKAQFKHLARAQIGEHEVGFLKILFHRETKEILGIHSFGDSSAEIIHIGQVAMDSKELNVEYFASTTFNYPTMAEAYRIAALNGLNKLF